MIRSTVRATSAEAKLPTMALLVAVILASSCGGKAVERSGSSKPSGPDTDSCSVPAVAFSSLDAIVAARCSGKLPPGAKVGVVMNPLWRPDARVLMDRKGLAGLWTMSVADATGNTYSAHVADGLVTVTRMEAWGPVTPGIELNGATSSAKVVPDAVRRLEERGVELTDRSYLKYTESAGWRLGYAHVDVTAWPEPGSGGSWRVAYSLEGEFAKLCGPCAGTDDECLPCDSE
jgi:hypothetical protein